jgi:hypothetical protein
MMEAYFLGNGNRCGRWGLEILLFTVVAVVLYLVADRLLVAIETRRGAPLGNRTLVFFVILLGLALSTFALIRAFVGA